MEYAMNKFIMAFFALAMPLVYTGCSKVKGADSSDAKPVYINLIPPAFQGRWVRDLLNCSDKFDDYQVNILENQLVFKNKLAHPSQLQLAGRALYIDADVHTENGEKKEKYEFILSANGKTLVSSDGVERYKCTLS